MLVRSRTPIRPTNRTASFHSSADFDNFSSLSRSTAEFELCRPFLSQCSCLLISDLNVFQRNVGFFQKWPFMLHESVGGLFQEISICFVPRFELKWQTLSNVFITSIEFELRIFTLSLYIKKNNIF